MPANIAIDYDFISEWHPQNDIMENDEPECRSLVPAVGDDIDRTGTTSEDTFFRILDWKAPRVKRKINQAGLGNYLQAIEQAYNARGSKNLDVGNPQIIYLDNTAGDRSACGFHHSSLHAS